MKHVICLLLLCSFLNSVFAQHHDASQYVILPFNSGVSDYFPPKSVKAELNRKEINKVEQLLNKCIKAYNVKEEKEFNKLLLKHADIKRENFIIDLTKYKRQFIVATTPRGEKVVWVNCFCSSEEDYWNWGKKVVAYKDGGKCLLT